MKARQRGRAVVRQDIERIKTALDNLLQARSSLRDAGSNNAANYVQRAIKSTQGALNNARAHLAREERTSL
jgi:hypothetical protein